MLCGPWSWERSLTCECLSARATLCTVTAPPNLSTGVQGLRSRMVVNTPADLAILLICTERGRRPWGVVHGVPSLNRLHATLRIIFASAALWRADFRYNHIANLKPRSCIALILTERRNLFSANVQVTFSPNFVIDEGKKASTSSSIPPHD